MGTEPVRARLGGRRVSTLKSLSKVNNGAPLIGRDQVVSTGRIRSSGRELRDQPSLLVEVSMSRTTFYTGKLHVHIMVIRID